MGFWITSAGLSILVLALMLTALLRRRESVDAPAAHDIRVYRDQLKELERDLARGVVRPDEAERTKLEISRRILSADKDAAGRDAAIKAPEKMSRLTALLVSLVLLAGSYALYHQLGAAGYPDLPLQARLENAAEARASRPDQATVEASVPATAIPRDPQFVELMVQLRSALERRPNDVQGFSLLASNEAIMGNFEAAYRAQGRVLELKGDSATADDYAKYADFLVLAAGGYVSPEAENALMRSLQIDRENGTARYYSGLLFAQNGRPDLAFQFWRGLLDSSPSDAPWVPAIRAQIEDIAYLAGVKYTLPPEGNAPIGPNAADVEAAQNMSVEERTAMIRNMVEGLSARLASEGGTPAEWARLITALGVLGEQDRAQAIWADAQEVFADSPAALAEIGTAAENAGIAE